MFRFFEIGWNYSHPSKMIYVNQYDEPGLYSLVLFRSPTIAEVNGESFEVKPGGIMLFPPETRRCYNPKERSSDPGDVWSNDFIKFYVDGEDQADVINSITPLTPFYPARTEHISRVIKELSEMSRVPDKTPELYRMMSNRLEYILLFIVLNLSDNNNVKFINVNAAVIRRIKQTRTYMMENPGLQWDVGKMAEKAGVSQSYFFRLYKKIFGTSPMQDLNTRRIEKAKYYFSCTVLSIKEVAYKLGYKNEYYFIRAFKAATGLTPGKYCKLHQNNDTSNVLYINEKNT